jgi:ATP-dependent helicase/nuclease subunit A
LSTPPTAAQRRAADPAGSVWVTANAGTGKTRVLTDRILRLLLAGADPEGILAITFTKAAAAEMTERVERRLAGWSSAAAPALAADLDELLGRPPEAGELSLAPQLLGRVLELPRGLAVQTIHALAGSLLRRFPLEAAVPPHFTTIDERTAAELLAEARGEVLARARGDLGPLGRAVANLAIWLADGSIAEALAELVGERLRLERAREREGGPDGLVAAIGRALRAPEGLAPGQIVERACADGEADADALARAVPVLAESGRNGPEHARRLAAWLGATPADRVRLYPEYKRVFLTADEDGGAKGRQRLLLKADAERHPEAQAALAREQARLLEVEDAHRNALLAAKTAALLTVAFAVLDGYAARKARAAALDYDDLIDRALRLLERSEARAWVLYKLDARIEHVLVDEAQDTSPDQWALVELLADELLAGEGADRRPRTLFVVGDEKQSIFSFQGADLASFRAARGRIGARARAAGLAFAEETLERSFRSTPAVLELVDAVLRLPEMAAGIGPGPVRHESDRQGQPGEVVLWPLAEAPDRDGPPEPWPLPDRPRTLREPEQLVAEAIARTVRGWLDRGERLEATGQPIRPGDVMVLVQRRTTLQERVLRALQRLLVPVAGASRLALDEHLAVQDLLALARTLLLPEDDLTLACLLKSPLLGLEEDDLLGLAAERGRTSLLERLRERAALDAPGGRLRTAYARLEGWLERADFMPPFELLTWILGADGGRRRLLERLGPDALEPIEALLGQALAYEQGHPASLEGLVHWLGLGGTELRRDAERPRDAVSVLTVHGAKGLEAPIVFLADAGPYARARTGRLVWGPATLDGGGPELPFWRAGAAQRDPLTRRHVAEATARERAENLRLLYVALTRARDRLIVTGRSPRGGRAAGEVAPEEAGADRWPSWHELLGRALRSLPGVRDVDPGLGDGFPGRALLLRRGEAAPAAVADRPATVTAPLPGWASAPAPPEPVPPRPLAPSAAGLPAEPAATSPRGAAAARRRRLGSALHRLLELLPALPPAEREAGLARGLDLLAGDLPDADRAWLAERCRALLADPALATLFGPDGRAEQAIVGVVGGVAVSGQVDRMVVTPGEVLVVDLKTGRPPPGGAAATPLAHLRQLALYRELLARRFADRPVRCGLLWAETGELVWLDPALLTGALPPPP